VWPKSLIGPWQQAWRRRSRPSDLEVLSAIFRAHWTGPDRRGVLISRERPAGPHLGPTTRLPALPIESHRGTAAAFGRGYSQRKRRYRFWGETMAQRMSAGPLLITWLLLDLALLVFTKTAGARYNPASMMDQQTAWTAIDAFLVWRVWRGGRVAWALLLGICVVPLVLMMLGHVGPWGAYDGGLFILGVAQVLILLTPAVRHHVSRS
jgi:hypothetical protein